MTPRNRDYFEAAMLVAAATIAGTSAAAYLQAGDSEMLQLAGGTAVGLAYVAAVKIAGLIGSRGTAGGEQ